MAEVSLVRDFSGFVIDCSQHYLSLHRPYVGIKNKGAYVKRTFAVKKSLSTNTKYTSRNQNNRPKESTCPSIDLTV